MRRTLRKLAVVPIAVVTVLAGLLPAVPAAAALPPTLASWRVTISGTASRNAFTIDGTVTMHRTVTRSTTNGVNEIDVCLKAGFPAGLPSTGAIWYGSNSACFQVARANLDLAYVGFSGDEMTVRADGRLQALVINLWTGRPTVSTCPYSPTGGSAVYRINSDGSLSGSVRLQGYGGAFCGTSTYDATVRGVRTS
jgi:hypothetical protein